ncbi:complex I subunit 5 family protein [Halothermothrix orenii]|uniref:NADH dehydrogenase I subunit M n=1 Tax=Halothermothrix orenii (strain H 168 / OCM 544 / DSM 9562) TaxID=373903 RepID=B8CXD6_HALOH|nr:complex I subunit 5 family protein [Halothermothrix orenii]ACL69955.1 NADH dehydrogenase I subunit M [Halothermothrix orenii H 168]
MIPLMDLIDITNINMYLALTAFIINMLTIVAGCYYFKEGKYIYIFLNLGTLIASLIVILTSDWVIFLVAWELVTLFTAIMIFRKDFNLGVQYFLVQLAGTSLLLLAVAIIINHGYDKIGYLNEVSLQTLLIIGVGTKSALFGLHFWLPVVHSKAPSPISALLSGWVVNLGYILLARTLPGDNRLLFFLGVLMIIYGGLRALASGDYKLILAYSTISQLGYIALGLGIGSSYGKAGALIHILSHGLAKTVLFIGSGYWEQEYRGRVIFNFKKPFLKQPGNYISSVMALLSLMGIIFFPGYLSKYYLKYSLPGGFAGEFLIHLTGIVTFLYGFRLLWFAFFKDLGSNFRLNKVKIGDLTVLRSSWPQITGILIMLIVMLKPDLVYTRLVHGKPTLFTFHNVIILFADATTAIIILVIFKGIKKYLKPWPDFKKIFRALFVRVIKLSRKLYRTLDTEKVFEGYFYNFIRNLAAIIYRAVYVSFQFQLLWIPVIFLLLLVYLSLATANVL